MRQGHRSAGGSTGGQQPGDRQFTFWGRYLSSMSILFGIQATTWVLFGSFDPLGFYDRLLAQALFEASTLPFAAATAFSFAVVPLGSTTAAFFLLVHALVRHGFPKRERWCFRAVVAALLLWFCLDSAFSVVHGAWFNVLLVNVPCLLLLGVPLIRLRTFFSNAS